MTAATEFDTASFVREARRQKRFSEEEILAAVRQRDEKAGAFIQHALNEDFSGTEITKRLARWGQTPPAGRLRQLATTEAAQRKPRTAEYFEGREPTPAVAGRGLHQRLQDWAMGYDIPEDLSAWQKVKAIPSEVARGAAYLIERGVIPQADPSDYLRTANAMALDLPNFIGQLLVANLAGGRVFGALRQAGEPFLKAVAAKVGPKAGARGLGALGRETVARTIETAPILGTEFAAWEATREGPSLETYGRGAATGLGLAVPFAGAGAIVGTGRASLARALMGRRIAGALARTAEPVTEPPRMPFQARAKISPRGKPLGKPVEASPTTLPPEAPSPAALPPPPTAARPPLAVTPAEARMGLGIDAEGRPTFLRAKGVKPAATTLEPPAKAAQAAPESIGDTTFELDQGLLVAERTQVTGEFQGKPTLRRTVVDAEFDTESGQWFSRKAITDEGRTVRDKPIGRTVDDARRALAGILGEPERAVSGPSVRQTPEQARMLQGAADPRVAERRMFERADQQIKDRRAAPVPGEEPPGAPGEITFEEFSAQVKVRENLGGHEAFEYEVVNMDQGLAGMRRTPDDALRWAYEKAKKDPDALTDFLNMGRRYEGRDIRVARGAPEAPVAPEEVAVQQWWDRLTRNQRADRGGGGLYATLDAREKGNALRSYTSETGVPPTTPPPEAPVSRPSVRQTPEQARILQGAADPRVAERRMFERADQQIKDRRAAPAPAPEPAARPTRAEREGVERARRQRKEDWERRVEEAPQRTMRPTNRPKAPDAKTWWDRLSEEDRGRHELGTEARWEGLTAGEKSAVERQWLRATTEGLTPARRVVKKLNVYEQRGGRRRQQVAVERPIEELIAESRGDVEMLQQRMGTEDPLYASLTRQEIKAVRDNLKELQRRAAGGDKTAVVREWEVTPLEAVRAPVTEFPEAAKIQRARTYQEAEAVREQAEKRLARAADEIARDGPQAEAQGRALARELEAAEHQVAAFRERGEMAEAAAQARESNAPLIAALQDLLKRPERQVRRYPRGSKKPQGDPIGAWDLEVLEETAQAAGYPPTPEGMLKLRARILALAQSFERGGGREIRYGTSPERIKVFGEEGLVVAPELRAAIAQLRAEGRAEYPTGGLRAPGLSIETQPPTVPEPGQPFKFSTPETETRFQAAKRGKVPGAIFGRVRDLLSRFRNVITRTHEHLPRGARFAEAQEGLRRLSVNRPVAGAQAAQRIQEVILPFKGKPQKFDLFTRKVILEDLAEGTPSGRLPYGYTEEGVRSDLGRLNALLKRDHPDILAQFERRTAEWAEVTDAYMKAMKDIGFDASRRLTREHYFRHQILDHLEAKGIVGTGRGVRVPKGRGFLKRRRGSELDISSNYVEAEWEVMGQMIHDTRIARFLKSLEVSEHNIAGKLRSQAKAQKVKDWHSLIPEGYRTFQPQEGNVFYMADTIPQRLMKDAFAEELESIGVPVSQVRKALARGGKFRELVLPEELVLTLENYGLRTRGQPGMGHLLERGAFKTLRAWKAYQLINPKRIVNYNARNATGDLEAVLRGNPGAIKQLPQATRELYRAFTSTEPVTGDLALWRERGGQQGLLQAQEIGQINELPRLLRIVDKPKGTAALKDGWRRYWQTARLTTDFRESLLRYAAFRDYLAQIRADARAGGPGRPRNFGASMPEEVMALKDPTDRAYKLSNELLGAYDQVSAFGQWLRNHFIPFWSWQEINIGREARLLRNIAQERGLRKAGSAAVVKAGLTGVRLTGRAAKWLLGITGALSAAQVYNMTVYPEVEAALDNEQKARPHIIMPGSTPEDPHVLWRIGAIGDFLEWFGLDDAPNDVRMVLNGHKSLREWAEETALAPLGKVVESATPYVKMPYEALSGLRLWPKPFERRPIRDVPSHLARSLSVGPEVTAITGRPQRKPYLQTLKDVLGTPVDTAESSYWEIFDMKRRFQEKVLDVEVSGFGGDTKKSKAVWMLKRALRYGDTKAIEKYAKEYAALGGTRQGLRQTLKSTNLYYGIPRREQQAFRDWLGPGWADKLKRAEEYEQRISANADKAKKYLPVRPIKRAESLREMLSA